MVVAGKVFKFVEPMPLEEVATKLDGHHVEEEFEEDDYKFTLITEVTNLLAKENTLRGVYSHDFAVRVFHRGKVVPTPRTVEAVFSFSQAKDSTFLTVVEKKRLANFIDLIVNTGDILRSLLFWIYHQLALVKPDVYREF